MVIAAEVGDDVGGGGRRVMMWEVGDDVGGG